MATLTDSGRISTEIENTDMKKVIEILYLSAGLFLCALSTICLLFSSRKLTYLEYRIGEGVRTVTVMQSDRTCEAIPFADEDGLACYEIPESLTLDILPGRPVPGTALLCDKAGHILCEIEAVTPNDAFHMEAYGVGSPPKSTETEIISRINFHIPFLKRPAHPADFCLIIQNTDGNVIDYADISSHIWFGGSRDPFWTKMCIFGIAFSLIYLFRTLYLMVRKRAVSGDAWLSSMILMAVTFAVMCVLASERIPTVMDENDNIIGGMIQTGNNAVLYRDYVTQHMPAGYWLCAMYSMLGAKSIGEFRLLFILTVSIVMGLLYLRFHKTRFASAIVVFSICLGPLAYMLIGINGGQILSDNIQAMAMTVLLLEMMVYYEDHRLGIGRSLIVSLCVFAAVGSAFMSVYSVFACVIAVIAEEIRYHLKNPEKAFYFIRRYVPLLICVALPWAIATAYLAANGALEESFKMAFRFNVDVYAKYGMPGRNPVAPFYSSLINIEELLLDTWRHVEAGEVILPRVAECCMLVVTFILLIAAIFRRGLVPALGLFFFIETQASRQAVQFHSIMLWYVVFMFILAELPGMGPQHTDIQDREAGKTRNTPIKPHDVRKMVMPVLYIIVIIAIVGPSYVRLSRDVLQYRIRPVPLTEMQAVNDTEEGEKIFVDGGLLKTDYILYKRRYPVSRLCWTLPWYYEWYGKETVQAVRDNQTKVVIYKLNPNVWKVQDFATEMDALILSDYKRVGELNLYERM